MNGDHHYFLNSSNNAVAGPSKAPQTSIPSPSGSAKLAGTIPANSGLSPSSSSPPHQPARLSTSLFLPLPAPPPPKQHLESTQDLLARFHLHRAYDRYVRPPAVPGNEATSTGMGAAVPSTPGDKGKGREVEMDLVDSGLHAGSGGGVGGTGDGEDDEGFGVKGEKKKKNSYKHLIKGLPGKHSMKKDDYLTTMMLIPPKQRANITPFDTTTQEDAFTVSPEGLKGWNINALVLESAQAREDRKKRKELKRLAKLQQQQSLQNPSSDQTSSSGVPLQAPIPTSATAGSSFRPQGTGTPSRNPSTPRPGASGTPRPGSTVPRPGSAVQRPGSAMGQANQFPSPAASSTTTGAQGVPRSTVPRPGSTVPRPGSAAPGTTNGTGPPQRPGSTKPLAMAGIGPDIGTPNYPDLPRGKKREREDGVNQPNVPTGNGVANGPVASLGSKPIVNAKAGMAGVRPRPVKKQRMDVSGPPAHNGAVQQQPTPQGV